MPFNSITSMYENMPKGQGQFGNYPTLNLKDGDIALFHYLADGGEDDPLCDAAKFHSVDAISNKTQKAYSKEVFCSRSYDEPDSPPSDCESCAGANGIGAQKVSMKMGIWVWCYCILHKINKDNMPWPQVPFQGKTYYREDVEAPVVWKRGPGKDGVNIHQISMVKSMQGTLNKSDFTLVRTGASMQDTVYRPDVLEGKAGVPLNDEQKAIIPKLPSIRDLFTGKRKWPDDGLSAGDEMMTGDSLATMLENKPATSRDKIFG